ncbi:MAG: hypothetical protein Kow0029_02580 [Candidatus Rifleibacteriota bacterium]
MAKQTSKKSNSGNPDKSQTQAELAKIIEGLKSNSKFITDSLKSRIGPGDWKLWNTNFSVDGGESSIDMIFVSPDGKKEKYVLIDISVPHLAVGQKYLLPTKAKHFQKEQNVSLNRIKKAIILVRKGTETISARPSRIRCPIIEIQLEKIQPQQNPKQVSSEEKDNQEKQPSPGVSQDLLFALKEAIVHECLSTMHKRRNKYIRKGLWRWIEREIMDPNVHFYLIILSTIYQGKVGEVLSKKFKTADAFSSNPDEVIAAIFSKETNLADEIKKNSERHKKALGKFLACFSQTPPFEYIRTLFLKEFRSTGDGLKARMSVFTTLAQLLERCGFEGEKETQYPLEILDELGIFQGIMTGNYSQLRIDNASKKLKRLVPQIEWGEKEIYQLRDQLAKALNLPAIEFNLNAFLPQAFFHDAKVMAEARKEAFRSSSRNEKVQNNADKASQIQDNQPEKMPVSVKQVEDIAGEPFPPKPTRREEAPDIQEVRTEELPTTSGDLNDRKERLRSNEYDEASHRNFESFGGQLDEDMDSIRLALAMCRYEAEKAIKTKKDSACETDIEEEEFDHKPPTKVNTDSSFIISTMPPKKRPAQNSGNRSNNNRRRRSGNKKNQNKRARKPNNNNNNGVNR